jgi:hypothetical protein
VQLEALQFIILSTLRVIKSRKMRCVGHVTNIGEIRNAYKILFENPKGRDHLGERFCSMESVFITTAIIYFNLQ